MFGRRADGRRVKKLDPIVQMTPYLMPMRCDAQVFLEHKADYEKLSRYIVQKSREGQKVTFMQILVAAYVRAISRNPEVNRFIFNKQYYSRNNCSVSYTVLKDPQDTGSNETTVRILFDLTDTLFDVRDRMNAAVEASRATEDGDFVIRLASALLGVPGLATLVVSVVKLLDRYGIAPKVLLRELPFYSGMFITNNGSIGLHHPWHHIYNFEPSWRTTAGSGCAGGCRWASRRTSASAPARTTRSSSSTSCTCWTTRRSWKPRRKKCALTRAWNTMCRRSQNRKPDHLREKEQ